MQNDLKDYPNKKTFVPLRNLSSVKVVKLNNAFKTNFSRSTQSN